MAARLLLTEIERQARVDPFGSVVRHADNKFAP